MGTGKAVAAHCYQVRITVWIVVACSLQLWQGMFVWRAQAAQMAYIRHLCCVQLQQRSLQVKTGSILMASWHLQALT